jgi:NTP pyrophosphatase (non-canonical NTP hydrolase)
MLLNEYQEKSSEYRVPTSPPEERIMGLFEEAGEVAGIFKRLLRGDYLMGEASAKLHKELGDVLWYLSAIAADNNWTLAEVAQSNLDKLESRKIRNLIVGTGSDR